MDALQLGVFAALLQVAGYAFYGSKILKGEIQPNATSWLMFAYGTALVAVLEWDLDAGPALLILPVVCAISSLVIAVYALRRARSWMPEHLYDRLSFAADILLTLVYVLTWYLLLKGVIVESQKDLMGILILAAWTIGELPAFYPLLRQVYHEPTTEHAVPWMIWTCAYFILALATLFETGGVNELMLYPLINMLVHGAIGFRVGYWRYTHKRSIL